MKVKLPVKNKTLCLMANTKVGDLYGYKIINCLKADFGLDDLKIIGSGGRYLEQYGQKSIFDINDLREKFLHLWRYSTKQYNNMKYHPTHLYQVSLRMNNNLIKLVSKKLIFFRWTKIMFFLI